MKANWILLALGLGAASCTTSQRLQTRDHTDLGVPNPEVSATYAIVDGSMEGWNTPANVAALHDEIDRQMHLRGYASVEPGDFNGLQPDILVYCSVFDRPISFPTGVRLNPASPSEKPVFTVSKTKFKDGLLLLQLKDTHTQAIFWVGHADGLNVGSPKPDPEVLRENTRALFDGYKQMPNGYQKRHELEFPRNNQVVQKTRK